MKFLHISDTHIRCDYRADWLTKQMFNHYDNPTVRLRNLLSSIDKSEYDFVLVTGDLTHEGEVEDYQLFKSILDEHLGDTPYFFCRGNHDQRTPFFTGLGLEPNADMEYVTCNTVNGLRIITLDSARDDHHEGQISERQLGKLKEWLQEPSEKGTIVLMHHPLMWHDPEIMTLVPEGFRELLDSSDVLGIFVGHIHQASVATYGNTMQYMAESIAFGVDEYSDQSIFVNRTGYNTVYLEDGNIIVCRNYITPQQTMIGNISKPFDNEIFSG